MPWVIIMKQLKISEYGTVFGDNFSELPFKEFLKKLRQDINLNVITVQYNKNNGKIYFIDNEHILKDEYSYFIDINDVKELNINKDKNYILNLIGENDNSNSKIIEEIEKTGVIKNDIYMNTYINYLKEEKKSSFFKFLKYLRFLIPLSILISSVYIVGVNSSIIVDEFLSIIFSGICTMSFVSAFVFLMSDYENIGKYYNSFKLSSYKLKKSKLLNKEKFSSNVISFDDSIKNDIDGFKDEIMSNINELIFKLDNIDSINKKKLLKELREIVDEYTMRYNNIINCNNSQILLDCDNLSKLKLDIIKKIVLVESKILSLESKSVKTKQLFNEKKVLDNKFSNVYINGNEIENELNKRNKSRVKVKVIEKNSRDIH